MQAADEGGSATKLALGALTARVVSAAPAAPAAPTARVVLAAPVAGVALASLMARVALVAQAALEARGRTLTVPFRSPLEAEMAHRAMAPDAQPHRQVVQKEFTVNGSVLAVWTAEDPGLLQISINSFLDQLSLVMRNIRRIGAIFPLSLGRGKGG
ncbi:EKC/KEOPS complex subunit LAGE3-like [Diceros bicornis minor]|uniref:EKC/KEOPS complex subunit LAGE3-like n=1 Tax=Diceros bicornis minor TaxID=77932 RepID=UPI0026F152E5|nr:EKC/KEOPS complex subunit LAGE3-like [Diceros bicornis minor]XP_058391133.1 EKC/KEOPS complex subunit LAGE3-like [Diceros bicornis minor]